MGDDAFLEQMAAQIRYLTELVQLKNTEEETVYPVNKTDNALGGNVETEEYEKKLNEKDAVIKCLQSQIAQLNYRIHHLTASHTHLYHK